MELFRASLRIICREMAKGPQQVREANFRRFASNKKRPIKFSPVTGTNRVANHWTIDFN